MKCSICDTELTKYNTTNSPGVHDRGNCMQILLIQRDAARADRDRLVRSGAGAMCITCGGSKPESGLPCVCGGTGRMIDEVTGLRLTALRAERERNAALDELKKETADAEEWSTRCGVAERARNVLQTALVWYAVEAVIFDESIRAREALATTATLSKSKSKAGAST
jgi:hypothetical protein